MPERNAELAAAVARDGRHKYEIAIAVGVSPSVFAGYLSGRYDPNGYRRRRIADVLDVAESDIFPEAVPAA